MTSKVFEGHKSSSNFSVNPTLPLLDGHSPSCSLFPSLSLTLTLYFFSISLFCSMQKLLYTNFFGYVFLSGLSFILPFGRFYKELQKKSILSLYLLPFTSLSLSLPSPIHLSLSLSLSLISLSLSFYLSLTLLLSIFLHGVSNGRFLPCSQYKL